MCKKLIYSISFVLVLGLAGSAMAQTYRDWDDGDPGDHLWSSPRNWNPDGLPTMIGSSNNRTRIESGSGHGNYPILDATIFAVDPNGAFTDRLYVGHLQGDGSTAKLWVMDGAKLTIGDDLNIAYDDNSHGICYVSGRSTVIDILDGVKVGRRGDGTLAMTGGTINVAGTIEIPSTTTTKSLNIGHLQLDGGTINCAELVMRPDSYSKGTMDVRAGTLVINGDAVSTVQKYIDNGWITAYDRNGGGILHLDYNVTNSGKTTLKATHVLNPRPADGSSVSAGAGQLQWTLPEPNKPGGIVTCDVYFGTNPTVEANAQVVTRQAVESVSVTLVPLTTYYWALDLYDSSISNTEPFMLSPIFTFDTMNQPPVVNAGGDIVAVLKDGPKTGNLDATVTDDGALVAYTVHWTVLSEPSAGAVAIKSPNAVDTSITLSAVGQYVLQLEAFDGEYTSSDTVTINVYDDSCQAAQSLPSYVPLVGDLNGDCKVDDDDLALLQENWLKDNSLTEDWIEVD